MKTNRYLHVLVIVILLGVLFIGCRPRVDTMAEAEKVFIRMVDKTAAKLDLNGDQKIQLERLKSDIRENFQEGQKAKKDALTRIKEEGKTEDPEIRQMTSLLQGLLRDETERINRAFDLMLEFQTSLNEAQKEKLTEMISDWVARWD